jgi:glycosyltransferase involved in cell wall biosynthesis
MADSPLVSVVIAAYNMAQYLPLAVRSALGQTYGNVEVIVIDDGSRDDTREVMAPFLREPRFRYLGQDNQGQAAAKNHGVREARGEHIAFLDADDIWVPEKLEQQIPLFLRSEDVGVVYSRLAYIDETGRELRIADNELFRGRVSGPLLVQNFIGFSTSVVRKRCFDHLGGFDEAITMGIDYDLWLRFSTQYEFDFVDRPLIRYRLWAGQMSNNCKRRYLNGIAIMERFIEKFPGVVEKSTEKEAWAHTYVGYGQCLHQVDRRAAPALALYMRALRYRPGYLPAWRAILTAILGLQ